MRPMQVLATSLVIVLAAAVATALLLRLLRPVLVRYALARPNARSSHVTPTPQGGGIAVVGVALALFAALTHGQTLRGLDGTQQLILIGAGLLLALVGAVDDIRPLPVLPRLAAQFTAAVGFVWALPAGSQPLQGWPIPSVIEWGVLVVGLVWFINLTNFMDGIDWMTVVEMVPILAALALLAHVGGMPLGGGLLAVVLLGAMLGFAPANKHVAQVFLGDVGSLPIGGLVGYLLIVLAGEGKLAAALILPLYYLADSGITLYRRWQRGERLSEAHRSHFYQRALGQGWSVPQVTTRVLQLNAMLAVLAISTTVINHPLYGVLAIAVALALTVRQLQRFEQAAP